MADNLLNMYTAEQIVMISNRELTRHFRKITHVQQMSVLEVFAFFPSKWQTLNVTQSVFDKEHYVAEFVGTFTLAFRKYWTFQPSFKILLNGERLKKIRARQNVLKIIAAQRRKNLSTKES